jgi:hypothetical protein
MNVMPYSPLQLRELFHLEVLRRLAQKLKPSLYALKGGVNMRFFFHSPRYSEDMDLDVREIGTHILSDSMMSILDSSSLKSTLATFGIRSVIPPNLAKAKQTETTQRFKIHLVTSSGEDLFTKIEFSRRGMEHEAKVETVHAEILRTLRLPPLMCPHYLAEAALLQKIGALAGRSTTQARDIFDLYLLTTQAHVVQDTTGKPNSGILKKAIENVYSVDFNRFRDSVLAYFSVEDRTAYDNPGVWDEIRLTVSRQMEEML